MEDYVSRNYKGGRWEETASAGRRHGGDLLSCNLTLGRSTSARGNGWETRLDLQCWRLDYITLATVYLVLAVPALFLWHQEKSPEFAGDSQDYAHSRPLRNGSCSLPFP